MASKGLKERLLSPLNRKIFRILLLILTSGAVFAALVLPFATRPSAYAFEIGDVSIQDIQAPYSLNYISNTLTEQAKQDAQQKIPPVYLPVDPAIARRQIEKLRSTLSYISIVRADSYATVEQKFSDLAKITDLHILRDDADLTLSLNDLQWDTVQKEALGILEQIMRDSIRDDQLKDALHRIPTLISFTLPQDEAVIVSDFVIPFVIPNSLFSQEQTDTARTDALKSIDPVTKKYVSGEIIVRRGQIITPQAWEALQQFDLIHVENNSKEYLAGLSIVLVLSGFIVLFFNRRGGQFIENLRSLLMISITLLLFLFSARYVIPNRTVIPYLFPIPAFGLTIASLFNLELGVVLSLVLSILTGYGLPNSLELTIFYTLTSLVGVMVLGKGLRVSAFFWAGISIGLAGSAAVLAYNLSNSSMDLVGITTLIGAAFLNGLASASLTLLLQFLLSQMLGLTTAIQLLEISRPDHPLLQFILQKAPGSYQHSLQVAILAEQAAERIGADQMLVRVGGIYHDAGKALNPSFFIENQPGSKLNTHDDLLPVESSKIIIQHVYDGLTLARRHHLPPRIQDFMREHHGTMLTRYQYAKALELSDNDRSRVDENQFRYPGPIPGSRETALLMLADGCEARVRAELPETEDEIRVVVKKVIDSCQKAGQLDNTKLTLRDLSLIADSFVATLKNSYHPRIRYPEIRPAVPEQATLPIKEKRND
jgi:cyclic-di-AMP phosphodiesterase PgpH